MTDITYDNDVTKTVIVSVNDYVTNVLVPISVIRIRGISENNYAFYPCRNAIKTVTFESGSKLEEIQNFAFYKCSKLENIDLSLCTNLHTIGTSAFGFAALKSITFPTKSLKTLGNKAFESVPFNTVVHIPACVTDILSSCFYYSEISCVEFASGINLITLHSRTFQGTHLTTFTLPKTTTTFMHNCLENTRYLETIIVEDGNSAYKSSDGVLYNSDFSKVISFPSAKKGVFTILNTTKEIGYASTMVSQLTEIILPNGLNIIRGFAFSSSLFTKISLPDTVNLIEPNAFDNCKHLTTVKISAILTGLPDFCFYRCNISRISIPDKITSIGNGCFQGNPNLVYALMPSSLTQLGGGVFRQCHPDIDVEFPANSNFYIDEQHVIMDRDQTFVSQYIGSTDKAIIEIPDSVQTIKDSAFLTASIESVVFGERSLLTSIENSAFSGCQKLKSINLPKNLGSIGIESFLNCILLEKIVIPAKTSKIGKSCFQNTAVASVVFEGSLITEIPESGFDFCKKMSSVKLPTLLEKISIKSFEYCEALKLIEIPNTVTTIEEYAFQFSGVEDIQFASESLITTINDNAFINAESLTTINLPDTVTTIGHKSFLNTNITKFTVPTQCTTIGDFCFNDCKSLENFVINNNSALNKIGLSFVQGCSSLKSIDGGNTNFVVENGALYNNDRSFLIAFPPKSPIRFFYFPEYVKKVGQSSFFGCNNLVWIVIPENSLTHIGVSAFSECKNLKSINIPISIIEIGKNAFYGCESLECGVIIDSTVESFIDKLINVGGLRPEALRKCVGLHPKTCDNKKAIAMHYSWILAAFLLNAY